MKNLKDRLTINEGWIGKEGEQAYDKMLKAFENMSQEDILNMIWNYLSDTELKNIYKWMKQDEYFD